MASSTRLRHTAAMDTNLLQPALNPNAFHMDSAQMWAGLFWSGVGGGYLIYGWRQKSGYPLAIGVILTLACFLAALPMTVVCIVTLIAIHWLMKHSD